MPKTAGTTKGFDSYIEIFRGGNQVDSTGTRYDGDALIDTAVSTFNAADHQPPMVAGHPKADAPAYGWVDALKTEMQEGKKVLLAKFTGVMPEFEELVKNGRYKKRSAAFYPDGRLRHVGFLGAVPPAVKGLSDIAFGEGEPVTFEFSDYTDGVIARLFGRIREYLIEEKGVDTADRIVPDWDVETLKEEAKQDINLVDATYNDQQKEEETIVGTNSKTFSEADIEAAKKTARQEGIAAAQVTFAEEALNRKKEEAKESIATFCKTPVKDGGPLPAWIDGGLQEFMEGLDCDGSFEFGEGKTQTSLDWFTSFLGALPASIDFAEHATSGNEPGAKDDAIQIARKATAFKEEESRAGRTITFTDAVGHVTKE